MIEKTIVLDIDDERVGKPYSAPKVDIEFNPLRKPLANNYIVQSVGGYTSEFYVYIPYGTRTLYKLSMRITKAKKTDDKV